MSIASKRVVRQGIRSVAVVGIVVGAMTLPRIASAQDGGFTSSSGYGITLANQVVQRYYPGSDSKTYPFRAANLNPNDINFQDCEDNIHLIFNLTESTGGASDILQVWAGTTDCTQTSARSGLDSPFCWQVAPAQQYTQTASFDIYARALTKYVDSSLDMVPNDGNFIGNSQLETACHTQTSTGQVALSIYFMFLSNTGDATPDASYSYPLNVDLVGPLAPYGLTAGIGENLLLLNWNTQVDSTIQGFQIFAEDQGPNGLGLNAEAGASILNTPIYCHTGGTTTCQDSGLFSDDSGIDSGADATLASSVDAACTTTFSDASALSEVLDATTYASVSDADLTTMGCFRAPPVKMIATPGLDGGSCTSTVLVDKFTSNATITEGEDGGTDGVDSGVLTSTATSLDGAGLATGLVGISEIDASTYGVGNVGGNTTTSFIVTTLNGQPLIDGHQYAVAVAAYDDDGNVGILSNLACQTPEPIIDFWDQYTSDGGTAGGGFCALEAPGAPVAGSVFGMGLGVAVVTFARRRRRRNS